MPDSINFPILLQPPKNNSPEPKKRGRPRKNPEEKIIKAIISQEIRHTLWVPISMAAKFGAVHAKTLRRALQDRQIRYKIAGNRYLLDFGSVLRYLHSKTKLRNKLNQEGLGQYIAKWRE